MRPEADSRGYIRAARVRRTLLYALLVSLALVYLVPLVWLISSSLKTSSQVIAYPPELIPDPFRFANFSDAFDRAPLLRWIGNSVLVTGLAVFGTILASSLVGFGFARLEFPFRDGLFAVLLATMTLPSVVLIVPQFVLFRSLGWIDTFLPLVVPAFLGESAFSIFLFRQYFRSIPRELDDAARVDGASTFRIWWNIFLPVAKPVIATVAILSFAQHWNTYLEPLVYLTSEHNKTLALGLRAFVSPTDASWNVSMAASMFLVIPVLTVFLFAQRYVVDSQISSGLK